MVAQRRSSEFVVDRKERFLTFKRRSASLLKMTWQLSTLCATPACIVISSPEFGTCVWPDDRASIRQMVDLYKAKIENCSSSVMVDRKKKKKKSICGDGGSSSAAIEEGKNPIGEMNNVGMSPIGEMNSVMAGMGEMNDVMAGMSQMDNAMAGVEEEGMSPIIGEMVVDSKMEEIQARSDRILEKMRREEAMKDNNAADDNIDFSFLEVEDDNNFSFLDGLEDFGFSGEFGIGSLGDGCLGEIQHCH